MIQKQFRFIHDTARKLAADYCMTAPIDTICKFMDPTRSLEQSAKMWLMLNAVSKQHLHHGRRLSPDNWKDIFTASIRNMDVVPNLEGNGFVVLGLHTSTMSIKTMSDLIMLIQAFCDENSVEF